MKRLTQRGLPGALFRYQLMANIVGVLIIPLFVFAGLHYANVGGFKVELAIFGVGHGYLYIVYLIAAGFLALKARLHIPWIILMFVAGPRPGPDLRGRVDHRDPQDPAADGRPGASGGGRARAAGGQSSRSMTVPLACPPPSHIVW